MKGLRNILLVLLAPLVASGCATTSDGTSSGSNTAVWCSVAGAGLGGAAGAAVAEKAVAGIIPGVVVGGALGYLLCRDGDSDGDGIPNSQDLCPDTQSGMKVDRNGCADADGDGVPDSADRCPGTPEGISVDEEGCPPDSDGDGVADYNDECPDTLPGVQVGENGCATCGQLLASVENITFAFNSAKILPDATGVLNNVASTLESSGVNVRIVGHTDNIGSDDYNLKLSKARAQAVSEYLVSRGVLSGSISAVTGEGEGSPIATNDTQEGREKNRRVEIIADCGTTVM